MSKYETIQQVAKDVAEIQNASNITAVLRAWGEMQSVIRRHSDDVLKLKDSSNHPCNIAMLSKVTSLMKKTADGIGGVTGMGDCGREIDCTSSMLWDNINLLAEGKEI